MSELRDLGSASKSTEIGQIATEESTLGKLKGLFR
jgi:hypothetical protein